MRRVLLPAANEKDLHDLPEQIKAELSIELVRTLEEAKEAHEVAAEQEEGQQEQQQEQQQQEQTGRTQGVLASRL